MLCRVHTDICKDYYKKKNYICYYTCCYTYFDIAYIWGKTSGKTHLQFIPKNNLYKHFDEGKYFRVSFTKNY